MSIAPEDELILPPRRESFLARYPRKLKLAVTALALFLTVAPPIILDEFIHRPAQQDETTTAPTPETKALTPKTPKRTDTPAPLVQLPTTSAPSVNDQDDRSVQLPQAPDPRFSDDTPRGTLPKISDDGTPPWRFYARPYDQTDTRPRVAIVLTGLGLSRAMTDRAITALPPTVTLAFEAQAPVTGAWISRARQNGHETLLQIPMEPFDYPRSDPGPDTLLTTLPGADNLARFTNSLRKASGYIGIISTTGSRFTSDPGKMQTITDEVAKRGLLMLDAKLSQRSVIVEQARAAGAPVVSMTQKIDRDMSPQEIAAALSDLENTAVVSGRAVGVATATPVMIETLENWSKTLPGRGLSLAPVSAMVR